MAKNKIAMETVKLTSISGANRVVGIQKVSEKQVWIFITDKIGSLRAGCYVKLADLKKAIKKLD